MTSTTKLSLDPKEFYFLPLGGSEQFGVNFNLYAYGGKWLAVDCGIGFADWRHPGIDIMLPDPAFIAGRSRELAGLIVTHAHEDHVGAVHYLWPRLQCPIYCTEFTASVLRRKMEENPECRNAEITIIDADKSLELTPFTVHAVQVAHSIPDAVSLVIETPAGRIVHSGDWNLDPAPVIGKKTDEKKFKDFGKKGITAYIGDSTNAGVSGRAGSESEVEQGLTEVFRTCKGRIVVTQFSSNIARLQSIARAAETNGRKVCVLGRSLHKMIGSARDCGMLTDLAPFVAEEDIESLADENVVMVMTGSQGEPRAMLSRISRGDHSSVKFRKGDTVIFSSRAIPGNERDIISVQNNLAGSGVHIITPRDCKERIHVSGHPYRDEIADMYHWLKPKLVVPVHGERTQLEAQAELARSCQIGDILVPNNGSVVKLSGTPEIVDHVETGLLAVERNRVLLADHQAIAERRKLQYTGALHISVALDVRGDLAADPLVTSFGLFDPKNPDEQKIEEELLDEVEDILADIDREDRQNDHAVQEEIRIGMRRVVHLILGIKPKTTVHVIRV